jgi:hypothetical protein
MLAAITNDPGSVQEMEARVKRETQLSVGDGSERPLFISGARVRNLVSILYRYHRIELAVGH